MCACNLRVIVCHLDLVTVTWTLLLSLGPCYCHLNLVTVTWTLLLSIEPCYCHLDVTVTWTLSLSLGPCYCHLDLVAVTWTLSLSLGPCYCHLDLVAVDIPTLTLNLTRRLTDHSYLRCAGKSWAAAAVWCAVVSLPPSLSPVPTSPQNAAESKKIRYRDDQVVSTKGERFSVITKKDSESEEMKKTYINLKPLKHYRFH